MTRVWIYLKSENRPMKRILLFLLLGLPFVGQGQHLRIDSIAGFPSDTASEALSYPLQITVSNLDSVDFQDTLDILIRSDTTLATDTLASDTVTILGFSSITMNNPNYVFSPTHFDDGDNIVVVWPQARNTSPSIDSSVYMVYFVSLAAGIPTVPYENLFYPNPAVRYLNLGDRMLFGQVRIFDMSGRLVSKLEVNQGLIFIDDLQPGMYLVETSIQGQIVVRRFVKQ